MPLPYCGHAGGSDEFLTQDQIECAKSVAWGAVTGELNSMLNGLEMKPDRGALFGIGMEVETADPYPVQYYAEEELEEDLVCDECGLHYSIYGVFGYCPDCAVHNSWQIFRVSRDVIEEMLGLAESTNPKVTEKLVENAIEDAVSSFDGFGCALCRANAEGATDPEQVRNLSFQNIRGANSTLREQFDINLTEPLEDDQWRRLKFGFEKRHLLTHRMGEIDERYVEVTGSSQKLVGRQVTLDVDEVQDVLDSLEVVAQYLHTSLTGED